MVCGFEGMEAVIWNAGSSLYMAWWLSWLERRPVTAEVVGSNPIRVAEISNEIFDNFIMES